MNNFMKHSAVSNKVFPTVRTDYQKLVKQIFKQLNVDEVLTELQSTIEAMRNDIADLKEQFSLMENRKKMFTSRMGTTLFNDGQWLDGFHVVGRKDKPMRPAGAADWIDDASRNSKSGYGPATNQDKRHRLPPGWYKRR